MRVGYFCYGMRRELTGIGRYTVELTRALHRVAPAIEIVLINPYPDSDHPWYREFENYPAPGLQTLPAAATLGNLRLHQAALELGLDILHDPCGIAPFLVPTRRYRRITTVHDAIPFMYPGTQPLLTRAVFQTLIRAARFTADAVITVSRSAAADLKAIVRLRQERLFVTPLGISSLGGAAPVEAAEGRQRGPSLAALGVQRPYFLSVGALHPRKNLGRLIEAFEKHREAGGDAQLVIVGPPAWGARDLQELVDAKARPGSGIVARGFVTDEELHALYRQATALVFPSLYEGFGLPALEAMALGTPVIAANTSSLPEVVGDAGLLVDPLSVGSLAEALDRVASDEELRRQMTARGLRRAAGFTWETTAERTLAAYLQVLAS